MHAIDANVLVRLITRDDVPQAASAGRFVEQGAWVSLLALAEATWVLTSVYDHPPADIAKSIQMLLDHQELVLQDPDVVAEALAVFKERPRLGFSDCLLVEIARRAGHLPLGTFDRNLSKVDGTQRLSG